MFFFTIVCCLHFCDAPVQLTMTADRLICDVMWCSFRNLTCRVVHKWKAHFEILTKISSIQGSLSETESSIWWWRRKNRTRKKRWSEQSIWRWFARTIRGWAFGRTKNGSKTTGKSRRKTKNWRKLMKRLNNSVCCWLVSWSYIQALAVAVNVCMSKSITLWK